MKRMIAIIFLMCLCIVFSACEASDPENLFGTTEPVDTTTPMGESLLGEAGKAYAYSNMQKEAGGSGFVCDGQQILFSHILSGDAYGSSNLYTFDLTTGKVSRFCQDAVCIHEKKGCPSLDYTVNLEQYDGHIYAASVWGNGLVELQEDAFVKQDISTGFAGFFHANGDLYLLTKDQSLLRYPGGEGQAEVVLDEFSGHNCVMFGDMLYYSSITLDACRIDLSQESPQPEVLLNDVFHLTDGEHIYYSDSEPENWAIYRCDLDGTNVQCVVDAPSCVGRAGFDETYFYYVRHHDHTNDPHPSGEACIDLWRFPKAEPGQQELIATIPATDGYVYTVPGYDRIFLLTFTRESLDAYGTPGLFSIRPDGTDLREHPLPVS